VDLSEQRNIEPVSHARALLAAFYFTSAGRIHIGSWTLTKSR
jgi:hypothetical protein